MRENFVILPVLSGCVCSFSARCALDASSDCVQVSLFDVLFCWRWKHKSDVNKSGNEETFFRCCFCLCFDGFCADERRNNYSARMLYTRRCYGNIKLGMNPNKTQVLSNMAISILNLIKSQSFRLMKTKKKRKMMVLSPFNVLHFLLSQ